MTRLSNPRWAFIDYSHSQSFSKTDTRGTAPEVAGRPPRTATRRKEEPPSPAKGADVGRQLVRPEPVLRQHPGRDQSDHGARRSRTGLPITDRTEWTYDYMIQKPFDCPPPPNFKLKLETGVKNGDCLLHASRPARVHAPRRAPPTTLRCPRNYLRQQLIRWIKSKWTEYPVFNPEMEVHELMWMQHDMGITDREREERGAWGDTPDERLAAYTAQCDKIYARTRRC